jgi:tetratricopeptide (TPR) repeat protein
MASAPDHCFPSKIEDVIVLQSAVAHRPNDHRALYYLGNFWYANDQHQEAIACWEQSVSVYPDFATVNRNLSLAHHNKLHDVAKAMQFMEKAFALDNSDARILMELDQLYKLYNRPAEFRLNLLTTHQPLVEKRDDLYLEYVTLLNMMGRHTEAQEMLSQRRFHPWEGGEGKTVSQFLWCHFELAKQAILNNKLDESMSLLDAASVYPLNLGEGKLPGTQENDLHYLRGCCFEKMGMHSRAKQCFEEATKGISEPVQAIFYNDPQPDKIVYQGLAWLKLSKPEKANAIFARLVEFGKQHMNDDIRIDYFAVSLPDLLVFDQDLNLKNRIHCIYLQALGNLGLMRFDTAARLFDEVLELNASHQGAIIHRNMIAFLKRHLKAA